MTTPPEEITVICPKCGEKYQDWYRASMNLQLDNFDDEYLEQASTATCPHCEHKVHLDVLVVREDGAWVMGPTSTVDERFAARVEALHPKFEALLEMPPVSVTALPKDVPKKGVYLLSEGEEHLYVGRSNRIRQRLQEHSRPSADHFSASFAFRIVCEEKNHKATYKPETSRAKLMEDPAFREFFEEAKRRVRAMDVRYVAEDEPIRQALLEMYAAVALETPYNDFDNH